MEYFCVLVLLLSAFLVNGTMVPRAPTSMHKRSLAEPDPSSGRQRLLVVTVDYPSQKGKYTAAQWQNDYFSTWKQYHEAQSYNTLQYDVDVVTVNSAGNPVINDPTANSYIPLQNPISAYANNAYGWDFRSKWNLHTIVREAATFLDSKNFSWTPYVQKGRVVNVLIMSAGHDFRYAQTVVPDAASKHLLSTSYYGAQYSTNSGAYLNSYTFCSEHTQFVGGSTPLSIARVGQCMHEHGHALGIPDLYDISYQSSGVGFFDMLGYGVYAGDQEGGSPVGYGAYTKNSVGWAKPQVITSDLEVALAASSLAPENFLKIIPDPREPTFFYLVENRQAFDTWDKNMFKVYGNGILIWRVNETAAKQFTGTNRVNTLPQLDSTSITVASCPSTPAVVLMEADGKQDMSTVQRTINYGSSKDVWQLGGQFNGPNSVSIAIVGLTQNVYTLHISFSGPIGVSALLSSSAFLLTASPFLLLLTFSITYLLL